MYKIKNNPRNKRTRFKKIFVVLFITLLVAVATVSFLRYQDQNRMTPTDEKQTAVSNTPDEEATTTPAKTPTSSSQSTRDGGAVDTNGEGVTPTAQPTKSTSGRITVYSPITNGLVKNGGSLTGASSLSSVNYRLIDDQVGVIGSGTLKVVNGKFSGSFSFNSAGKEGRLDVFRTLEDGREVDVVEIPVRYQ